MSLLRLFGKKLTIVQTKYLQTHKGKTEKAFFFFFKSRWRELWTVPNTRECEHKTSRPGKKWQKKSAYNSWSLFGVHPRPLKSLAFHMNSNVIGWFRKQPHVHWEEAAQALTQLSNFYTSSQKYIYFFNQHSVGYRLKVWKWFIPSSLFFLQWITKNLPFEQGRGNFLILIVSV